MDARRRPELIRSGRPEVVWRGEAHLGGWYGEEEIEVVVKTIRQLLDWTGDGFDFICAEIESFEKAFAQYSCTADAVSINAVGSGLDMAVMCLDLRPGDEISAPSVNFCAAPIGAHSYPLGHGLPGGLGVLAREYPGWAQAGVSQACRNSSRLLVRGGV